MATIGTTAAAVEAAIVVNTNSATEIREAVVSDLLSDVLVSGRQDFLLVTSLVSDQVIRSAELVDARAVLFTNGKHPGDSLQNLAREADIALLATPLRTFEAAGRLYELFGDEAAG